MIPELGIVLIYLIFTWVTFTKLPSPALISTWGIVSFFVILGYLGFIEANLLYVTFAFFVIAMALTAMVSGGLKS